ncbi:MAG: hypothetical protein Q9186_002570 [Xanthomendoza sp. 1 TL-2023]
MAYQQPILAPSQSTFSQLEEKRQPTSTHFAPQTHPDQSPGWLLFPRERSPSYTQTASTACSPQTAALSRLSEFGSLNTAARFGHDNEHEGAPEDDEDLDSLDEGLQAFQENIFDSEVAHIDHTASILPTHDGLGTFPPSSYPVQEYMWQFERFNPQRTPSHHHRRPSSVQRRLDALEADDGVQAERERMDRVERWRIEHSRILLEEVEQATRKNSSHRAALDETSSPARAAETSTSSLSHKPPALKEIDMTSTEIDAGHPEQDDNPWYRIVRKIIGDVMGINETTLAMVFGEAIFGDEAWSRRNTSSSSRDRASQSLVPQSSSYRTLTLLESLSQELASIFRRLAQSPTSLRAPVNPLSLDYAGIPLARPCFQRTAALAPCQRERVPVEAESNPTPLFVPTLNEPPESATSDLAHAALWGIEEEPAETLNAREDFEYWEQTPSIKTIFRLLHQHFTAHRRPVLTLGSLSSSKPSNVAVTATANSVRRAAVIRQHHPLVSRQHLRRSASHNGASHAHRHHGSYPNLSSPLFKRSESSCASISVRKGKRGSGSSRNYWDVRGSVGSGSMGGMGVWGEV